MSSSPDLTTNSETTNSKCSQIFYSIRIFLTKFAAQIEFFILNFCLKIKRNRCCLYKYKNNFQLNIHTLIFVRYIQYSYFQDWLFDLMNMLNKIKNKNLWQIFVVSKLQLRECLVYVSPGQPLNFPGWKFLRLQGHSHPFQLGSFPR